jgi:cytochrome P450
MTELDYKNNFDHFSEVYAQNAFEIWKDLQNNCPIAQSEKFMGMWIPTKYSDIEQIARDTDTFSSRSPVVAEFGAMADFGLQVPPISSDPPYHTSFRRLLLPFFSPARIEALKPTVALLANELIDSFIEQKFFDGAMDYAQHIPIKIIAQMLGIPDEDGDQFRIWVHNFLELAPTDITVAATNLLHFFEYFQNQINLRKAQPKDDLVTFLINTKIDERPLTDQEIFGGCLLLLVAGIDTTWSAIGASIWHLASHPKDQQRLRDEPNLLPIAIEEFLRAFAPVTMAREVSKDTVFKGCPMKKGDPVLLPFPAANRDNEAFENADDVIIDRDKNRHFAFGVGIHRCLGSNLARMELTTAVETLLVRLPEFRLKDSESVTWSLGQVRGPRVLPIEF